MSLQLGYIEKNKFITVETCAGTLSASSLGTYARVFCVLVCCEQFNYKMSPETL